MHNVICIFIRGFLLLLTDMLQIKHATHVTTLNNTQVFFFFIALL